MVPIFQLHEAEHEQVGSARRRIGDIPWRTRRSAVSPARRQKGNAGAGGPTVTGPTIDMRRQPTASLKCIDQLPADSVERNLGATQPG